jgi:hypothetical protein
MVACGTLTCRANGAVAQVANLANTAQLSYKYAWGMALRTDGTPAKPTSPG